MSLLGQPNTSEVNRQATITEGFEIKKPQIHPLFNLCARRFHGLSLMFWLYRSRASRRSCSGVLTQKGMIRPGENGILAVYLDLSWDGRKACELSLIQKSQHVVVYNRTRSIKTEKTNVEVDRQRITAEYDSRWSDVSVNLSNQERGSKRIYISIVSNQTNRVGGKNDLLIHD